jgi:hypothetical protein
MSSDAGFTGVLLLSLVPFILLLWFFGPGSTKRREASVLKERKQGMTTDSLFDEKLRQHIPAEDGRALTYLIREYGGRSNKNIAGFNFRVVLGEGGTLLCLPPVWSLYLKVDGLLVLEGDAQGYRVLEPDLWPKFRSIVLEDRAGYRAEKVEENANARAFVQAKLLQRASETEKIRVVNYEDF